MKDEDLKQILTGVTGCIAALAEKQSLILHLLSNHLPDISGPDRDKMLLSAQSGIAEAERLKLALKSL
jgi:hypothetical protein